MDFKNTERWNIIKMSNNIIPRSNCVGKETTDVPSCFLIHERCYYYFACTIVCGVAGVCF